MFGGTSGPCGNASMMSIGRISPAENKKHALAIYPLVKKYLNIPDDRMYITF